ncbi:uncharacterized protein [Hemitrygon akajei]|uniref:uncharacterized protein n=1 Tax=Hemitrygon akajei TaxID=2704970 RepID=UPI003BF97D35
MILGCRLKTRVDKTKRKTICILIVFTETVSGVAVATNNPTPLENLDTIALSCDASGAVQTRTWFKDNQPIRENGRIFTSPDKAKLTIISVNRIDAGTYKCIASNSFSSGAGVTEVDVYCKYTAKTDDNRTLGSGAIVGILLGLLGVGLIGGVSGWLIARKTGGIRDPPQSQYVTSVNSGRKGTLDTNTVNASGTYENFLRNEQGARNNEQDGNSTYTGLVLGDRSVYSDLKREAWIAKTDGNCTLGSGAIVGIVLGLLGVGLIGGVSGWLVARKAGGIKDPPQSQYDTSVNSGRKGTLDTNTGNASGTYENLSRIEQGARNKAEDGSSTYMGLVLENQSVYSDLKR